MKRNRAISSAAAVMMTVLLSMSVNSPAAPLDCLFEHYSSEDGLSHNSISDIHQDRQGFIWLSTWYGLNRFDGNRFVNYTVLPGDYSNLSHNRISTIDEDVNGYLWITTYDNGLYRFDSRNEIFLSVPGDIDPEMANVKVRDFICDKAGNVWMSLYGLGLYMMSPDLETRSYFMSGNVIGKEIKSIHEDSEGNIYVVSESGIGVVRNGEPTLLSRTSEVSDFLELDKYLLFSSEYEVLVIDKATGEQSRKSISSFGAGPVVGMVQTGSEEKALYFGLRDGAVASVDTATFAMKLHKGNIGRVRYLFPDSHGLLWVATDRTGIYSWNPEKKAFRHYVHTRNVMSYYSDTLARVVEHQDRLWIKMNNYGFGYYDREADAIIPLHNVKEQEDCRFMNGVACYTVDKSGVLWFSTVGRGLERATVITPKMDIVVPPTRFPESMSSSEVRAVLTDSRNQVWSATKSRELYVYSPGMEECRRFPGSDSFGVIYSIFEDSEGNIWLGTKGDGLLKLKPHGRDYVVEKRFRHDPDDRRSLSSNDIYSIEQDADGRIWVGTYGGGLSMLADPDADDFHTVYTDFPDYPLETGSRVRYLHRMPDGKMLVATVGGLIWFNPDPNLELTVFNVVRKIPGDIHSLGNNDIIYIFTDDGDDTWLCTFGGGLNRLRFEGETPVFDIVSNMDGLNSNIILSAVDDRQGNIWLATETGISKVLKSDLSVVNYSKYDGVVSTTFSEATCARLEDGTIIFGTLNNIYHIDPELFSYAPEDKMLVFSGLTIDGKRVPLADRIVIPYDYSFFRFDFASLNFKIQGNINYSYKLDGYNKEWISATRNSSSVSYSRIPAGRYTFMVSASTPDGHSDPQVISMKIRVKPYPWASWWAILVYVLIVLAVTAILIRMFITSVKLKNDVALQANLNDMKGRFFTNISHELRTPLTLILGGIEEIRKHAGEGSPDEYSINLVYKNSKRMMTLVNQLLDIRRIVNGKVRLNINQIDIVQLVKQVYDDFKDMSSDRQLELRLTHSVDSLMVWGDAARLEALVYNLLSNAFKYTSDGGRIEIGIFWKEGDKEFTIMVKDNGIGVPKEKQTAIFEPFIQASDASLKGMSSSGIGLSFCKEIVEVHGGRIWVESEKNKGSKFYVRLPVDRDHFSEETAQIMDADKASDHAETYGLSKYKVKPTFPAGAMKVLVVEDNAELRVYMYNCLINKYEVRDAPNGKEALQIIDDGWVPDMIVTDLMMPQMNGIDLINHIRADFNTSHIPVIMITAKHENDTHLKAMKYGADGYLSKPFTMELLIARMENLLERRKTLLSRFAATDASGGKGPKVDITPDEIVITDRDEELIKKVMAWLEENIADVEITVDQLAAHVGMGRTSMYNKIKGLTGKSPVELIQDFRMEKATFYLKSGQYSVSETSYKVGFSDPGYFSRSFKKHFGVTPVDYIKEHKANKTKE